MNRRIAGISLFLAVAAVAVLVAGCVRSTSQGPLPKPQSAQSLVITPTTEAMPTTQVATTVAGATATAASATEQPAVAPTQVLPIAAATPVPPTATPVPSVGSTNYTVKPGDRLFSIGRQLGVNPYAIAQANRIGPPYTIYTGQVLVIPGSTGGVTPVPGTGTTYIVQRGDTIYSIGRKFGRSPATIINANNLVNPNYIFPGQVLTIP